jgi:uncharacterized SAM-binding protein YcdF (DUF218 family)
MLKHFATPIVWGLALLTLGLALSRCKRRRICSGTSWWLVLAGVLTLAMFSLRPVANVLTYSLERRYVPPSQEVLETLDIVVVLGGDIYSRGGFRQEAELSGPSYSRVYNGVRVFRRSGAGMLALCGGLANESEAETMKAMALYMGVPEAQILTEVRSENTRENATRLAEMLGPGQGRRIGLVTSATHMLRSERVFRKHFPADTIIPVPVNYTYSHRIRYPNGLIPSVQALLDSTVALHEWIGILWYSLRSG